MALQKITVICAIVISIDYIRINSLKMAAMGDKLELLCFGLEGKTILISEELRIFDKNEWEALVGELALSPRQKEIVQRLFLGQSDKQIAAALGLAQPTVRTHFGRLFAKFNVQDRHELILHIFHHFRRGCVREHCPRNQSC